MVGEVGKEMQPYTLAQWLEHMTFNHDDVGSNPMGYPSTMFWGLMPNKLTSSKGKVASVQASQGEIKKLFINPSLRLARAEMREKRLRMRAFQGRAAAGLRGTL